MERPGEVERSGAEAMTPVAAMRLARMLPTVATAGALSKDLARWRSPLRGTQKAVGASPSAMNSGTPPIRLKKKMAVQKVAEVSMAMATVHIAYDCVKGAHRSLQWPKPL